jgi:hypothetical protein
MSVTLPMAMLWGFRHQPNRYLNEAKKLCDKTETERNYWEQRRGRLVAVVGGLLGAVISAFIVVVASFVFGDDKKQD